MNSYGHNDPQPIEKLRMNGWACASVAILLVSSMFATIVFAGGIFLAFRRSGHQLPETANNIIVRPPSFIPGPAIEMSLPAGSDLASSSVDADGGNWWYQGNSSEHLQLLIAASRTGTHEPAISDAYLQRVIRIVERSGGDLITAMGPIQVVTIGSYSGRRVAFDVTRTDGTQEHAAALLIRRESDDLLVILYGDQGQRPQVDRAAQQMFDSLHPRPTPQQYDVHTARSVPPDLRADSDTYVMR